MDRPAQIALAKRLLAYVDDPDACLAPGLEYNDKAVYASAEQHAAERAVLFRRYPLVAAFSSELRAPGDFVTVDLAGLPVLVVRDRDGHARAFRNVCRHRGAAVVEEPCGRRQTFACPYHAWVYDTQGRLVGLPDRAYGFADVDRAALGLLPLPSAERHGLVFVQAEADGAAAVDGTTLDVDAYLGALGPELATYGFAGHHHFRTETLTRPFNWKLVADGFWEGYHIRHLHTDTVHPIIDGRVGAYDAYGRHHRLVVPRHTLGELRGQPEAQWAVLPKLVVIYSLFPNTVLVYQGDHIEVTRTLPGRHPGETTVRFSLFAPQAPETDKAQRYWERNMELLLATVEGEDFRVARRIQASAEAGEPRYQVLGGYEPALAHFHRQVRLALGQPALVQPPPEARAMPPAASPAAASPAAAPPEREISSAD